MEERKSYITESLYVIPSLSIHDVISINRHDQTAHH